MDNAIPEDRKRIIAKEFYFPEKESLSGRTAELVYRSRQGYGESAARKHISCVPCGAGAGTD